MARKEKNIYYIYKTTCNVTERWYIGMHSTYNLDDGYMGSGKILRYSIRKYGVENHTKEIIEYLPTREDLILREIEIITKELISDGKCMNLKEGGDGGWMVEIHNKAYKEKLKNDKDFKEKISNISSVNRKSEYKNGKREVKYFYDWTDKTHSIETKKQISETKKDTCIGELNSQHGTCWVTKDKINKKININELDFYIKDGWIKGRVTKIVGELCKNSKLTNNEVIEIRKLINDKISNVSIAKQFNVKPETISKIKRNIIFKDI